LARAKSYEAEQPAPVLSMSPDSQAAEASQQQLPTEPVTMAATPEAAAATAAGGGNLFVSGSQEAGMPAPAQQQAATAADHS